MNSKPFYQSKTLLGVGILVIPNVLRLIDSWFGTHCSNPELDTICVTIGTFLGVKGRTDAGGLTIK